MKRPFSLTHPPEAVDSTFCSMCSSRTFYTSVLPEEAGIHTPRRKGAIIVRNLGKLWCNHNPREKPLMLLLKEGARSFCVEQVAKPKKCKLKTWRDCKMSQYTVFWCMQQWCRLSVSRSQGNHARTSLTRIVVKLGAASSSGTMPSTVSWSTDLYGSDGGGSYLCYSSIGGPRFPLSAKERL